jgi:hypothetical protein
MPALPIDYLSGKISVPSELRTAEWDRVPLWIRERSFFMAGVDDAEILDRFRGESEAIAKGEASESEARLRLRDFLEARGYAPEPGQEGTIKDLRSVERMNVALRTNVESARGWAQWQAQQSPGALRAFPARRYHRGRSVQVPRDWKARWKRATAATMPEGATDGEGELVALLNHPLWRDREFNRFGMPHTPFDFNSGMTTSPESRTRAKELGLLPRPGDESESAQALRAIMAPAHTGMNEALQARPAVESQALRTALAERLQGFARWEPTRDAARAAEAEEDEVMTLLVFTDPNGTRPGTPQTIAETIAAPLPVDPGTGERFPQLQADALDLFAEDPTAFAARAETDAWHDFARLMARIAPTETGRRDWLSRLVEESREPLPPGWIGDIAGALLDRPEWRAAVATPDRVTRFSEMLRVIGEVMN